MKKLEQFESGMRGFVESRTLAQGDKGSQKPAVFNRGTSVINKNLIEILIKS